MKRLQRTVLLTLFVSSKSFADCVPANEYIPFGGVAAKPNKDGVTVALGTYSRISPDGKYVLRSLSGDNLTRVTLMEVRENAEGRKEAFAYPTDLANEAFSVQGSWRFIAGIDGKHYRVSDLINSGQSAKSQFRGGITGFYATAAEIPGGSDTSTKIRSLSWPNSENQNVPGYLKNKVLEVRKNSDGSYTKISESSENTMCENLKKTDGTLFSLPMISTDGKEFAAMPQNPQDGRPSMRIYAFGENDKDCKLVDDLGFVASKVMFGFPQEGKKTPLVYLGTTTMLGDEGDRIPVNGVHIYDRDLKRSFYIGDRSRPVDADAFPGMTKDGRVMYGARWQECRLMKKMEKEIQVCDSKTGYVIADPYQSEDMLRFKKENPSLAANMKKCVTKEEVAKVEADQKNIYGLSSRVAPRETQGAR